MEFLAAVSFCFDRMGSPLSIAEAFTIAVFMFTAVSGARRGWGL